MLGVPAIVVVGGYYRGGLPFGLEIFGAAVSRRRAAWVRLRIGAGHSSSPSAGAGRTGAAHRRAIGRVRASRVYFGSINCWASAWLSILSALRLEAWIEHSHHEHAAERSRELSGYRSSCC